MKNKCFVKEEILNPFFSKSNEENSLTADAFMSFTEFSSPTRLNNEKSGLSLITVTMFT